MWIGESRGTRRCYSAKGSKQCWTFANPSNAARIRLALSYSGAVAIRNSGYSGTSPDREPGNSPGYEAVCPANSTSGTVTGCSQLAGGSTRAQSDSGRTGRYSAGTPSAAMMSR